MAILHNCPALAVCAVLPLASCTQPAREPADTDAAVVATAEQAGEPERIADQNCRDDLKFTAATVYAGATDYYFTAKNGEEVSYRVENGTIRAQGFENLTAMGDEGPPDTNPKMKGKIFAVCETDGELKAIEAE